MKVLLTNLHHQGIGRYARTAWQEPLAPVLPTMGKSKFTSSRITAFLISIAFLPHTLAAAPTADQMREFIRQRPEQDMVHWKDPARGNSLEVRILEIADDGVRVQKTLASGLTNRVLPLSEISGISFARTPVEHRLIHRPTPESIPALRVLWENRQPTLGMDTSNAADIGIALAKALRMSNEPATFSEANDLLKSLAEKELGEQRKSEIESELRTLELARSIHGENAGETDRIAWEITEADPGPDAMLMATAWLADRHFEDLKALEKENPRWDLDDEVRPLRSRLYHLALDFALYPSLFHGAREEEAAAGLANAWRVHNHTNAPELALQTLEDLAALYPESTAAAETAEELARLRTRKEQGTLVEESPETPETGDDHEAAVTDETETTPPATPPQPKRYNIFDD